MGFVVVGMVGVALLGLSFLFDDLLDAVLPGDGWLSTPVLGAFLTATGFGAALLAAGTGAGPGPALVGGVAAGLGLGWLALRFSRAMAGMATDATPTSADLVGRQGRVVTPVPAGGTGEVLVRLGGQPVKLAARSDETLPTGSDVVVVAVRSPTRVEVQSAARFWARDINHGANGELT